MAAAAATSSSASVRYAPEDPTLPKPWKGLVDVKTGYLYFWNPETNITQYERPVACSNASSVASGETCGLSVQKSTGNRGEYDEEDNYNQGSNDGSAKVASGPGANQAAKSRLGYSLNAPDVTKNAAHGPYASNAEVGLSAEAYCRCHEITVTGGNVPPPFTSFQATGFPSEILTEVRYLLQEELNVVHCAILL